MAWNDVETLSLGTEYGKGEEKGSKAPWQVEGKGKGSALSGRCIDDIQMDSTGIT